MKILAIHSDYIKFKPTKKAVKNAEEVDKKESMLKECLVVFTSVEKEDEDNIEGAVNSLINQIKKQADLVKCDKIVLYPYAHLSDNLSKPSIAEEILKKAEDKLNKEFKKVIRAPFGWYKKFEISCKGHPLAEASRHFGPESVKPTGEKKRKEGSEFHRFILVNAKGETQEVTKDNWTKARIWNDKNERVKMLHHFVRNELSGNIAKSAPKHVEIMRKLELFDYVPYSDIGNLRAYPNGSLMRDLLSDFVLYNSALKLGCMKVENPLMFDPEEKTIKALAGDFHERDYKILSDKKEFMMRFSTDPLNFPMLRKLNITYKQMPFGIYEIGPSFRMEKRGECSGLKRARSFTMPDIHFFTKTEQESLDKIEELCYNFDEMLKKIMGDKWVLGWEIVEAYWEKYKDYFIKIVKKMKCPTFIKLMPKMSHYYAFKNEYQAIGLDGSNAQVSTLQLDVKDGERFDISYLDKDGKKKPCFIIHTAPIGSIERALYLILENPIYDEQAGKAPMLPLWLSPEQVRVIPVSDKHLTFAKKIASEIESNQIRVGVDDRNESIGKKVFEAKTKWIPYIIVVGDTEVKASKLPVVIRKESSLKVDKKVEMSIKELISDIKNKTKGLPFRPMYMPRLVSKRLVFVPWSVKKH